MAKYDSIIITLFKERYEKSREEGIQYRAFGEFDFIKITDAPISESDGGINYFKLWEKTKEASNGLDVGESCHNLYAFSMKQGYDKQFWCDKKPYLFVSLLQLKTNTEKQIKNKAEELEDYLYKQSKGYKEFNYAVYYSLDSCDFIVFIKSSIYQMGAEQVQRFPLFSDKERYGNSYCYSICGIDFEEALKKDEDDILEKVMICFVVKNVSHYQNWYKQFQGIFPQADLKMIEGMHYNYNRLGNEDVCINIMKCSIKTLVLQMQKNGCLWMGNKEFREGTMKLRIHFDTQPSIHALELPAIAGNVDDGEKISYIRLYEEKVSEEAKERLYPFLKKALEEVLKACSYLEQESFARDVQKCVKAPIKMLFDEMNRFWNKDEEKNIYANRIVFNDSVAIFVQGIMSIVNGSLHTDRMFFQSPGFNAVLYDIPVKVLAFYDNFVTQLVDKLNDNKGEKKFCYLLCPDLYLSIKIKKLFDKEKVYPRQRFLLGCIPVEAIFEPKRLMQELVHEVAHCVGDKIRMRERRFYYTIAMFAETIATSILSPADNDSEAREVFKRIYDKIGTEQRQNLHIQLTEHIKKYFLSRFKEKKEIQEFDYYQIKTKSFFIINIQRLLNDDADKLILFIDDIIKPFYKKGDKIDNDYITDMRNFSSRLQYNLNALIERCEFIIKAIHTLTNESFADLIMCEVLGIDMNEYVERFFITQKRAIDDADARFLDFTTNADATAERIVSVVRCYGKKIGELETNIKLKYFNRYKKKLMIYAQECPENTNYKIKRVLPPAVIRINKSYLRECREVIEEECEGLEAIRNAYKAVIHGDVQTSIQTLLNARVE